MKLKSVFSGALLLALSAQGAELQESPKNTVGFTTVAEALAAVRTLPRAQVSVQHGWTIVSDEKTLTVWSFTPEGNPAHPSVVKRVAVTQGDGTHINMDVLCEASKAVCDDLVLQFEHLNQQMAGYVKGVPSEPSNAQSNSSPPRGKSAPDEINVTSDSAPGWLPSSAQRALVPHFVRKFFAALDGGRYQEAYNLMAPQQKALETFERFTSRTQKFTQDAGALKELRILKITWTKDPANAPAPGIYAAVDIANRYARVDRHCGYVMLYESDGAAGFQVMRQEDNFITNKSASQIARDQSPKAVDEMWARLSQNCPNAP